MNNEQFLHNLSAFYQAMELAQKNPQNINPGLLRLAAACRRTIEKSRLVLRRVYSKDVLNEPPFLVTGFPDESSMSVAVRPGMGITLHLPESTDPNKVEQLEGLFAEMGFRLLVFYEGRSELTPELFEELQAKVHNLDVPTTSKEPIGPQVQQLIDNIVLSLPKDISKEQAERLVEAFTWGGQSLVALPDLGFDVSNTPDSQDKPAPQIIEVTEEMAKNLEVDPETNTVVPVQDQPEKANPKRMKSETVKTIMEMHGNGFTAEAISDELQIVVEKIEACIDRNAKKSK